jgi:superfamily II DNA or RNA helicase
MKLTLDLRSIEDYRTFLRIKGLPSYSFVGREAEFPDEYSSAIGVSAVPTSDVEYTPISGLFDYQEAITRIAIKKRKFAIFADCGLGKTLMLLEFARHAAAMVSPLKRVLIVSPLMVVGQTIEAVRTFYKDRGINDLGIEQVKANRLSAWVNETGSFIGITNYEALTDETPRGRLGALILDESSLLKSHYGKHGQQCLRLGAGLDWKLCCSGTPAPNDRIEYANHAVFLDHYPTVNSFLARFFVNRGQTQERWELKPHAIEPFYRALSHWSIFLTNPATYGWKDNTESIPPIHVHVDDVDMTKEQKEAVGTQTGRLFAGDLGGITTRIKLGRIAKGHHNGSKIETLKPAFIKALVDSWPDESTIIWCLYNDEHDTMDAVFPDAASIRGDTPIDVRLDLIGQFQRGERKVLISKPKILGFGLNLQVATRQVFSGLQDSYESFYQAVKRSNRYGSTRPLNVHIPVTDVERPMIETVLKKAKRVQLDAETQERIFKDHAFNLGGIGDAS